MTTQTDISVDRDARTVVMTRVFDAPRELVFQAYMDPEAIPQWWGPAKYTTVVEQMDVRPGGAWRYVQHDAEGNEFAFRGEYRDIVVPERIVYTFEWEGMPGHIIVDTVTFEEQGEGTLVAVTSLFDSLEDLEGMLQSGMEEGANESMDRLAAYLAAA